MSVTFSVASDLYRAESLSPISFGGGAPAAATLLMTSADGCRTFLEAGGQADTAPARRCCQHTPSYGNVIDRSATVSALLRAGS